MDRRPAVRIKASGRHDMLYIGVTSDPPGQAHRHRESLIKGFTSRYGSRASTTMKASTT